MAINDNTSDFDSLFAESTAEVEAGGGDVAKTKKAKRQDSSW